MSETTSQNGHKIGDFVEITRDLLKNRPVWMSYTRIRQDIQLTEAWLTSFAAKKVNDPGAGKVQRLYDYLSQAKSQLI